MGFFKNLDVSTLTKKVAAGLNQMSKDASISEAEIYKKATGKNKPVGKSTSSSKNTQVKGNPVGMQSKGITAKGGLMNTNVTRNRKG